MSFHQASTKPPEKWRAAASTTSMPGFPDASAFTTGNYKIKTTPEREWLQIVGDENFVRAAVPADDMKHGRVITGMSELLQRPLAVKAGLIKC